MTFIKTLYTKFGLFDRFLFTINEYDLSILSTHLYHKFLDEESKLMLQKF